jgi:gluconate 2-dehydrogenase gamma chain
MNRRNYLKSLAIGTLATSAFVNACKSTAKPVGQTFTLDRMKEEQEYFDKIPKESFFTPQESETIRVLADLIIPKDAVSGSASDAGVPEFIAFIVKDMPDHQVPMRGGLRWLDMYCMKKYNASFVNCKKNEQTAVLDIIAYPNKCPKEMKQGANFFTLMRNLTATGFYSSEMGFKDVGYKGNVPNQWNGVPDDELKRHGLAYTEKELGECVKF